MRATFISVGTRAVAAGSTVFAASCGVLALSAPAMGVADNPSLTIVGDKNLQLVISGDPPVKDSEDLTGTLAVTLLNPTANEVSPTFELVPDGTSTKCKKKLEPISIPPADADALKASGDETYELIFEVKEACVGRAWSLLVSGGSGVSTVTASAASVRRVDGWDYGLPLLVGGLAGSIFAISSLAAYGVMRRLSRRTPRATSWSFSGSWLTSISALSAALAGVLAATGLVSELLPGIPLGHFLGISLAFAALIVAAPMVFSVFQVTEWEPGTKAKEDDPEPSPVQVVNGTVWGLLLAGSLTVAGVAGQLAMLVRLSLLSSADSTSQALVVALLAMLALIAGAYVILSTRQAVDLSTPSKAVDAPHAQPVAVPVHRFNVMSENAFTGTF